MTSPRRPTTSATDLTPLFELLVDHLPAPDPRSRAPAAGLGHQPRRRASSSAASRCAASCNGTIRKGQQVAWCRADGTVERAKVAVLYVTETHERIEVDEAGPGEIIAVAGLEDVTIGETLADPDDPASHADHHRRRAEPVDDHRRQHLAAQRP